MKRTVTPARRLVGELRVPGELEPAAEALILTALAPGPSRIEYAPPGLAPVVVALGSLGLKASQEGLVVCVVGQGARGLQAPAEALDLSMLSDAALLALAALACQPFTSRLRVGAPAESVAALAGGLVAMGAVVTDEGEGVWRVEGPPELRGADHAAADLPAGVKLALLLAGALATGTTVVREPVGCRDRTAQRLRPRGVQIANARQEEPPLRIMTVVGGQTLAPGVIAIDGDLDLAMAVVVAALTLRGSEVRVRRVAVRPETRAFVDLLRQTNALVELEEGEEGTDLVARYGQPKATRVAEKRAERLLRHVPLLAVLATQAEGEFIIRDIEALRQGYGGRDYDYVAHLVTMLRRIEAKVGEYPEGIVIDGGQPLRGAEIDTRGDAAMVQAFAVAGLLADGDTVIDGAEGVDEVFPGFFEALDGIKKERKR